MIGCKHWRDCGVSHGGCCDIGAYARPSYGTCVLLCKKWEGPPKPDRVPGPGPTPHRIVDFVTAHKQLITQGRVPDAVAHERLSICTGITVEGKKIAEPCPRYEDEKGGWGTGHCKACGCLDWPISQMHRPGKTLEPGKAWFPFGCPARKFPPAPGRRA